MSPPLGISLRAVVKSADGGAVGTAVGAWVGAAVGAAVDAVGLLVGAEEGAAVGVVVGAGSVPVLYQPAEQGVHDTCAAWSWYSPGTQAGHFTPS